VLISCSHRGSFTDFDSDQPIQRKFKSARLVGEYEKPWLEVRSYKKRERADKIILGVCAVIGVIIAAFICFTEWNKLPNHEVSTLATFSPLNSQFFSTVYYLTMTSQIQP